MDASLPPTGRCPMGGGLAQSTGGPAAEVVKLPSKPISRRTVLQIGGIGAIAASLTTVGEVAWTPQRATAGTAASSLPDIQFDIRAFVRPARTVQGVHVSFGVLFTFLAPAALTRDPTKRDQRILADALAAVEHAYAFSPGGIFASAAYGLPYFNRLPSGLVASAMPRLLSDPSRYALEEAVPGPTDVSPLNPGIRKRLFNVPVKIESNDVLFTLRSDSLANITEVAAWFNGSGILNGRPVRSPAWGDLFRFKTPRLSFVQPGLPRSLAEIYRFPFADRINPASSMWMGFVDQQVAGTAPTGATVTFAGTSAAVLTTAKPGDYFDNGSIQHLSHVIDDLEQYYRKAHPHAEPFSQRVQYMFRSKTHPHVPGLPFPQDPVDPFTNGGGNGAAVGDLATQRQSAFLPNPFYGPDDQVTNFDPFVTSHRKYRVGHLSGLQRSSRAPDGTPLHIRNDGPGLSALDVPGALAQPTLEFTIFVPTAEFFRVMRVNSASLDYVKAGQGGGTAVSVPPGVEAADAEDDGLERFTQATRRQNFLVPPRRHRSFPLLEQT